MSSEKPGQMRFIDFEVEEEPWNVYDLKDGSRIKTKFVLVSVIEESASGGSSLSISRNLILGVIPPPELVGIPSAPYTRSELESSIIDEDIGHSITHESWNVYKLQNGLRLSIRNVLVKVSRTSKFDSKGIPIYIVNASAILKATPPAEKGRK